jgi:dynein heavy chain
MMDKFEDILVQFSREVDLVKEIFHKGKEKPPVSKNQPPVAGAIGME